MTQTPVEIAATLVLTYALHSAIACMLALATRRAWTRPQDRDVVWKAALIVPLVTSLLAVGANAAAVHAGSIDVASIIRAIGSHRLAAREVRVVMMRTPIGTNVIRSVTDPVASTVALVVVIAAAACMALALIRLAYRRRILAAALRTRWADSATTSARGRPLVVSTSESLQTPVAIGTNEICLPVEVASSFTELHRRVLVAHETAHLDRRDPAWFASVDLIAALSAFQPLVFLVVRAFRRDVELICDEAAVRATGDRGALLGALALLASPFDPRSPLAAATAAYDGSPLLARAERIADVALDGAAPMPRRMVLAAVVAILASLLMLPAVAPIGNADVPLPSGVGMHREILQVRESIGPLTGDEYANVNRRLRIVQ